MFLRVEEYIFKVEKEIIIIELARDVDLTIYTPICIVTKDYNLASKEAFVYGEFLLLHHFLRTKYGFRLGKNIRDRFLLDWASGENGLDREVSPFWRPYLC